MVSCKGLVLFTLKAINVTRTCRHCSQEETFCSEVILGQPQNVLGTLAELLGRGNHVDTLIQELDHFVLGDPVLDHDEQDLDLYRSLLHVRWYR